MSIDQEKHIVKSQVFQVDLDTREKASEIFDKIKTTANNRIWKRLDAILSNISNENQTFSFDQISLDLGNISLDNFENELEMRFEEALLDYFRMIISPDGQLKEGKIIDNTPRKLDLMESFLRKGYFGWNNNLKVEPADLLRELLVVKNKEVGDLISKVGADEDVRKRMIFQLDDPLLSNIVIAAKGHVGERVLAYKKEIELDQQENFRIEISRTNFRTALWEITLAYLFLETKNYYSRKQYLAYYVRKIAQRHGLEVVELLNILQRGAVKIGKQQNDTIDFVEIVGDLLDEFSHEENEIDFSKKAEEVSIQLIFDYVFDKGIFWNDSEINSFTTLNERIQKEFKTNLSSILAYFEELIIDSHKRANVMKLLNAENLNAIIDGIEIHEIKKRKELFDKVESLAEKTENFNRQIAPVLRSHKGRIILKTLNLAPKNELLVFSELIELIASYPGVESSLALEFSIFLANQFEGREREIIQITTQKEFSNHISKTSTQSAEEYFEKWKSQFEHLFETSDQGPIIEALIKLYEEGNEESEILDVLVQDLLVNQGVDRVEVKRLLKISKRSRPQSQSTSEPNIVSIFRDFESKWEKSLPSALIGKAFFDQIQLAFYNTIHANPTEIEKVIEAQMVLLQKQFHWLIPESIDDIKQRLLSFIKGNNKAKRKDHAELTSDKIEKTIDGLKALPSFNKQSIFAQLASNAATENISLTQLYELVYAAVLDDRSFIRLNSSYPETISQLILAEIKAGINHLTSEELIEKIKGKFSVLSNVELQAINEDIKSYKFAVQVKPVIEDLSHQIYNEVEVTEAIESDKRLSEIKILQHWLIKLNKDHQNWKNTLAFNQHILASIADLSKHHEVNEKTVKDQLLTLLKSRKELNEFEQDLVSLLIRETEDKILKKDLDQASVKLTKDILSYYMRYNQLPNWMPNRTFKEVTKMIKELYFSDARALTEIMRKNDLNPILFQQDNFMKIIRELNDHPVPRFYQFIKISENFLQELMKPVFGLSEKSIFNIRKRLLLYGLESNFSSDAQPFFNRLRFLTEQTSNISKDRIQSLIFYSVNDLEKKSTALVNWNHDYPNRKEILEKIEKLKDRNETSTFFDLLLEKRSLSQDQQQIFTSLSSRELQNQKQNEQLRFVLRDKETRKRLIKYGNESSILNLIKADLSGNAQQNLDTIFSQFDLLGKFFSAQERGLFKNALLNNLLTIYAVGSFRSLGSGDWKKLFYRTLNHTIGAKRLSEIYQDHQKTEISPKEKISLDLMVEEIQRTEEKIPFEDNSKKESTGETYFIKNAGLVILAPYFSRLFDRLGLFENGKFKDEEARFKAICYSQYLATGRLAAQEEELLLNKILCGLHPEDPIELKSEISDEDKAIMDGLLKAITQQWKPLNNTSIDGLRGSFLIREGKITIDDEYIFLKVQAQSFDMLLDSLPWSINLIHFKWMKKPITVDWR